MKGSVEQGQEENKSKKINSQEDIKNDKEKEKFRARSL
jgi:hypothetical protein